MASSFALFLIYNDYKGCASVCCHLIILLLLPRPLSSGAATPYREKSD